MKGDVFDVDWRCFSLEQANSKQGPAWKVWEAPNDVGSHGLPAFKAAAAAKLQGPEAYDRMCWALLEGRHERNLDYTEPAVIEDVARLAGLDMPQFKKDRLNPALLATVRDDHLYARKEFGVFGPPTFFFVGSKPFFMRMTAPKDAAESVKIFDALMTLFVERPNVDEVKRPRKPRV